MSRSHPSCLVLLVPSLQVKPVVTALQRCRGKLFRVAPIRRQKPSLRMCIGAWRSAMVPAHRVLDLSQNCGSLRARMPLPEQDEPLTAHAAMELCISLGAFAKDLHLVSSPLRMSSRIPLDTIVNGA